MDEVEAEDAVMVEKEEAQDEDVEEVEAGDLLFLTVPKTSRCLKEALTRWRENISEAMVNL